MTGRPGWPAKAGAMPSYDGFRLDDAHRCAPVAPEAEETDPQQSPEVNFGRFAANL
jgi:hypothetical protein